MKPNGKPETLDVLRAWGAGENPRDLWPEWSKVVYRLSENLAERNLVEYGTSPGYCWITDEGRAHLAARKEAA